MPVSSGLGGSRTKRDELRAPPIDEIRVGAGQVGTPGRTSYVPSVPVVLVDATCTRSRGTCGPMRTLVRAAAMCQMCHVHGRATRNSHHDGEDIVRRDQESQLP